MSAVALATTWTGILLKGARRPSQAEAIRRVVEEYRNRHGRPPRVILATEPMVHPSVIVRVANPAYEPVPYGRSVFYAR